MTVKKVVNHSEKVKKIRRKIEEKLRNEVPEKKIEALATLLDIDEETDQIDDQH